MAGNFVDGKAGGRRNVGKVQIEVAGRCRE
jgi:hypothetical protein